MRSGEEILADMDATLDQLIQNADVLGHSSIRTLCDNEIEALQKTQESLLARLIHMDSLLDVDQKKNIVRKKNTALSDIQQKIAEFSRLNQKLIRGMATRFGNCTMEKKNKKPRVHRNYKIARSSKTS